MSKQTLYLLLPAVRVLLRVSWDLLSFGTRSIMHWVTQLKACNPLLLLGWLSVSADVFSTGRRRRYPVSNGFPDSHPAAVTEPPGENNQPILVTGSHRSGTTWVGRMIALAPNVHYVHEPLNPNHDRGICGANTDLWFTYICNRNEAAYYRDIKRMVNLGYSPLKKIRQSGSVRILPDVLRQYVGAYRRRRTHPRVLIKGPISLFAAPWMQNRFDMQVIVMIRHPAAFASSLKIAGWHFPFEDWVNQPLLIEDFLLPFSDEIRRQAEAPGDVLDQAALLWKCMYHVVQGYEAAHPQWIFVRHENLSHDPIEGFRSIYQKLGLPFTEHAQQKIGEYCGESNPVDGMKFSFDIKRYSRGNVDVWKKRLSAEETLTIRRQVEPVSSHFYPPESWELN